MWFVSQAWSGGQYKLASVCVMTYILRGHDMGKACHDVEIDYVGGDQGKNWMKYAQNTSCEIIKELVKILKTSN